MEIALILDSIERLLERIEAPPHIPNDEFDALIREVNMANQEARSANLLA